MQGHATPRPHKALPGHELIWILIVSEILVFAVALAAFLVMRLLQPELFHSGAHLLHAAMGTLSMTVLLSSGFAAALAQLAVRLGESGKGRMYLIVAAALGAVFLVLKFMEYEDVWNSGVPFEGNAFLTLYGLITGFHAAHVIFGTLLLLLVAVRPRADHVEPAVAFWHMVDLVWVLVFPVVYLVPR